MRTSLPSLLLFRAVPEEVGPVLSAEYVHLIRYEPGDTATVLAAFGQREGVLQPGTRVKLEGKNATTLAFETGRSARIDDYGNSSGRSPTAPASAGCGRRSPRRSC